MCGNFSFPLPLILTAHEKEIIFFFVSKRLFQCDLNKFSWIFFSQSHIWSVGNCWAIRQQVRLGIYLNIYNDSSINSNMQFDRIENVHWYFIKSMLSFGSTYLFAWFIVLHKMCLRRPVKHSNDQYTRCNKSKMLAIHTYIKH